MDFVLLLLFLYIAFCCKPTVEEDLSAKALLPLRGLCAVGIVFHHVTQNVSCDGTLVFKFFDFTGPMFVAVFFALSGFALSSQYDRKGQAYLDGFLKKRLGSLLLPYFLYVILYFLVRLGLNLVTGNPDPVRSTSGTVLYSWYVKAIAYLYVLYYLAQRLGGGKPWCFRLLLGLGLMGYVLFCRFQNYGIWWYNAILAFPFGMVCYGLYRSGKLGNPWVSMGLSLAVFGAALVLRLKILTDGIPGLAMDGIISLAFPLLLLSFLRRFRFHSSLLNWLGSRSYEIYLAQGIPILILKSGLWEVSSPLVFCGAVLFGAVVIGEGVCRLGKRQRKS